jgi:hypothetical protein
MPGNPANRLEPHWPPSPPTVERHFDEESGSAWSRKLEPMFGRLAEMMGRSPKATLVAAVGLGVILGWIVKRR